MNKYRKFVPALLAIAGMSKDRSTKVGAIALGPDYEIRSTGYNGFPRGVDDEVEDRHKRPIKYSWTSHAEENLVAQAARYGAALRGCTVLVSALYPCSACARMLIQAGVKEVIAVALDETRVASPEWKQEAEIAQQMFHEAGVILSKMPD